MTVVGRTRLIAAIAVGALAVPAMALGDGEWEWGDWDSRPEPAANCPQIAAIYDDAGIPVRNFWPDCPTRSEANDDTDDHVDAVQSMEDQQAEAEQDVSVALDAAESGALQADVDPDQAEPVLRDVLSLVRDQPDGLTNAESAEFEDEANQMLDELRDSGDLPPTNP